MSRLILDLSRTLSRAIHPVPTGIDRVEMAYAEGLLAHAGDRVEFAAMHPLGRFGMLPRKAATGFLAMTAARWRDGGDGEATAAVGRTARGLLRSVLLGSDLLSARLRRGPAQSAYLLMSHHHLDRPAVIDTATRGGRSRFICLVHDLIPLEYKEYARPAEPARHQRRIETVARLADGVVVNSHATHRSLQPWLDRAGRPVPVLVAPLGTEPPRPDIAPDRPGEPPYFVFLGTIEPRKNHLLALHVWRRLAAELGPAAPRLFLIGRRGWEIEQVIDLVERCDALRGLVIERNDMSDRQALDTLRGARALLLPSFAEGYGLPVAEALAHGVPVLCSDLPAFREVGGDVPEYFDPVDGVGLLRAVQDYAAANSPRRDAQLARLQHWSPPRWDDHMAASLAFIDGVMQAAGQDAIQLDRAGGT